ncbi:MAG: hypothetical protein WA821_07900 [Anaerolineales bacterium]
MNKNHAFTQFIKDGLVGVAVVCLIYLLIRLATFLQHTPLSGGMLETIDFYFMPQFCLIMFISVGVNGRFIENITTRASWGRQILEMAGVSWLIGLFMAISTLIIRLAFITPSLTSFGFGWLFLGGGLGGGIGMLMGLVIASLAGVVFNPQKRLYRILISATVSLFVASGAVLGATFFAMGLYI